jgi:hypothetical protein
VIAIIQVPNHSSGGFGFQVSVIVVAACILGIIGWLAKRYLAKAAAKEAQRTSDMQEVKQILGEVRGVLITDTPSAYNPFPQKKLVDRFNELWDSHFKLVAKVDRMDARTTGIKSDTSVLVHESKTNEGGSMRDRVDETSARVDQISAEQLRVRDEKDHE